jgi:hypothetical protein
MMVLGLGGPVNDEVIGEITMAPDIFSVRQAKI